MLPNSTPISSPAASYFVHPSGVPNFGKATLAVVGSAPVGDGLGDADADSDGICEVDGLAEAVADPDGVELDEGTWEIEGEDPAGDADAGADSDGVKVGSEDGGEAGMTSKFESMGLKPLTLCDEMVSKLSEATRTFCRI